MELVNNKYIAKKSPGSDPAGAPGVRPRRSPPQEPRRSTPQEKPAGEIRPRRRKTPQEKEPAGERAPPASDKISFAVAAKAVKTDFEAGKKYAKDVICKNKKCCSVNVYVSCHGLSFFDTNPLTGIYNSLCKMKEEIKCNQ